VGRVAVGRVDPTEFIFLFFGGYDISQAETVI
jgi:hypothetical protein